MAEATFAILAVALLADWRWGEPDFVWSRLSHPVVLFGRVIGWADQRFNHDNQPNAQRYRTGALVISGLVICSVLAGLLLNRMVDGLGMAGLLIEGLIVFMLLAHNSLVSHVKAVSDALSAGGVESGRKAVGLIVGRNPDNLDRSGICRAAIESLAENFSDGVVAPAFWYAFFGLPGILAYKMINTADSMIGYRTRRHEHFGKAAARLDDVANWVPARLAAFLIVFGAFALRGAGSARLALSTAFRDGGLHASPNAGWPEAAMAGACNIALGGPRIYGDKQIQQAHLNAAGKQEIDTGDIDKALQLANGAFFAGTGLVVLLAVFA